MSAAVGLRLAGCALLVIAGALLGREKRMALERRARTLRDLAAALGRAQAALDALRCPLPELFARLSDVPFFRALSSDFGTAPLETLWRKSAEADRYSPSSTGLPLPRR